MSMRIACLSGMISMYEEHMRRKAIKLQRLRRSLTNLKSSETSGKRATIASPAAKPHIEKVGDPQKPKSLNTNVSGYQMSVNERPAGHNTLTSATGNNLIHTNHTEQIDIEKMISSKEDDKRTDNNSMKDSARIQKKRSQDLLDSPTCDEQTTTNQELSASLRSPKRRRMDST